MDDDLVKEAKTRADDLYFEGGERDVRDPARAELRADAALIVSLAARIEADAARIREMEAWIVGLDLPGPEAKHGCTRHFSHDELVQARAILARMKGYSDDRA